MEIGDIVKLKSGGPDMTIIYVIGQDAEEDSRPRHTGYTDGDVSVAWFDGKQELNYAQFNKNAVEFIKNV